MNRHIIQLKFLLLTVLLINIVSCSRMQLALSFSDNWLENELENQFNLSRDQEKKLNGIITDYFKDIKSEFIPKLTQALDEQILFVEKVEKSKLSEAEILEQSKRIGLKFEELKTQFLKTSKKSLLSFANTLQEKNWTHYKTDFSEKNNKLKSKSDRWDVTEIYEFFLGDLNKEQLQILEDWQKSNPPLNTLRVKNREYILSQFENKMPKFQNDNFAQLITNFIDDNSQWQLKEYLEVMEARRQTNQILLAKVIFTSSKKQLEHLKKTLNNLKTDFLKFALSD